MRCRNAERAMILGFYGDLDAGRRRSLDAHLARCPACARKSAEIIRDLEAMSRPGGARPEFDWERSWRVIRSGLERRPGGRSPRAVWIRRLLPAAAGLGLLALGYVGVMQLLKGPPASTEPRPLFGATEVRLSLNYLESVNMTLREYMNREFSGDDRFALDFEKERAKFLLLQNRTLRALARGSRDPLLVPLLDDLEIVLYEASNLEPASPGALEALRTLIHDMGIMSRSGRWGKEKLA